MSNEKTPELDLDLTEAELHALNIFCGRIWISSCKTNTEAVAVRKLYIATGKLIAITQGAGE